MVDEHDDVVRREFREREGDGHGIAGIPRPLVDVGVAGHDSEAWRIDGLAFLLLGAFQGSLRTRCIAQGTESRPVAAVSTDSGGATLGVAPATGLSCLPLVPRIHQGARSAQGCALERRCSKPLDPPSTGVYWPRRMHRPAARRAR